jgi:hypothetical protein
VRGVCYEHQADAALQTARTFWSRADDAVLTLEWALSRDPAIGTPIVPGATVRVAVFAGAKSVGLPTVLCTYEVTPSGGLVIYDLEFS